MDIKTLITGLRQYFDTMTDEQKADLEKAEKALKTNS